MQARVVGTEVEMLLSELRGARLLEVRDTEEDTSCYWVSALIRTNDVPLSECIDYTEAQNIASRINNFTSNSKEKSLTVQYIQSFGVSYLSGVVFGIVMAVYGVVVIRHNLRR